MVSCQNPALEAAAVVIVAILNSNKEISVSTVRILIVLINLSSSQLTCHIMLVT